MSPKERLRRLEKATTQSKGVAVMEMAEADLNDPARKETIIERHYQEHPEDRNAQLLVILTRFTWESKAAA